jgi:hypothetical protein
METSCISILFLLRSKKITSRGPSKSSISWERVLTIPSRWYCGSDIAPPQAFWIHFKVL